MGVIRNELEEECDCCAKSSNSHCQGTPTWGGAETTVHQSLAYNVRASAIMLCDNLARSRISPPPFTFSQAEKGDDEVLDAVKFATGAFSAGHPLFSTGGGVTC